jgi:hypothetical protein
LIWYGLALFSITPSNGIIAFAEILQPVDLGKMAIKELKFHQLTANNSGPFEKAYGLLNSIYAYIIWRRRG